MRSPLSHAWSRRVRAFPFVCLLLLFCQPVAARYEGRDPIRPPEDKSTHGVFALEGEFVHNVGELQINITNWGLIGSHPGWNTPYSDSPSAMWPAGSGVEYLFAAGLWVGAIRNGVPLVSTGQFAPEFQANPDDPLDTVYEMQQGIPGGKRFPDPDEDDDGDGLVNEDPRNALDDDADGLIDEDFEAIGNQHFRCVMRDNTALILENLPDHDPLYLQVIQQSFQWENQTVNDFVGLEFTVTNIGVSPLQDVYLGFFCDSDVGPREAEGVAEDDLPGYFEGAVRAADGSLVPISVAYMYDADRDEGLSTGFFGTLFLGHDVDPSGETAPPQVGIRSFQAFSGSSTFDAGGDPTNDAERYELLSREEIDSTLDPETVSPEAAAGRANDFRVLLATGPFQGLEPGESLTFQAAMVAGEELNGLKINAAEAALTYYGAYFDRDGQRNTGILGRETKVCLQDFGPPGPGNPIFTLFADCNDSLHAFPGLPIQEEDLDDEGCTWINNDCLFEWRRGAPDCRLEFSGVDPALLAGCTGIEGKEFRMPWLVGLAPPPPALRLWQTDGRVHLFWNNLSQLQPDIRLQEVDFESYRIWRADGWDRPFGSSVENGPESRLWRLIAEFDEVDTFLDRRELGGGVVSVQELPLGANTGFGSVRYLPAVLREGSEEELRFAPLKELVDRIVEENSWLTYNIDPASVLRIRGSDGTRTELGERYPELGDWECCTDEMDTLYWNAVGIEFYEYVDRNVHNGIYYFYSVTATDFAAEPRNGLLEAIGPGLVGNPQTNFQFASPTPVSQTAQERADEGHNIYVVPNPATRQALADFSQLRPNSDDPTGVRVMFSNLPACPTSIKIFTLAGDLVETLEHDGSGGNGAAFWNLVSRNGQEIVSGIYLYSVEAQDPAFERVIGRFVVIR